MLSPFNRMYKSYNPKNGKIEEDEFDYYSGNFTNEAYAIREGIKLVNMTCSEGGHKECGSRCCAKNNLTGKYICQKSPDPFENPTNLCVIAQKDEIDNNTIIALLIAIAIVVVVICLC